MTSIQEEMDDSRTSAVGRKRNLDEIEDEGQDKRFLRPSSEDSAKRATKRVKEDGELLEDAPVEYELTDTAALLSSASPPLSTEAPQTQPAIAASPRPDAWNKGVQSILRTSFGNRFQTELQPKPFIPSTQEDKEDIDPPSNPVLYSSNTEHAHTSPATNQYVEDIAMAETMDLQNMPIPSYITQDGEDTAMEEVMDLPETHASPTVVGVGSDDKSTSSKASQSQLEMTVSSGEDERATSSSRDAGDDAGMLHEQTSGSFGGTGWSSPSRRGRGVYDPSDAEVSTNTFTNANTMSTPFRFLSKSDQVKLSKREKAAYLVAREQYRHEQKIKDFEKRTAAAEAVFSHESLPLPSQYSGVEHDIASGHTFFPKQVAESLQVYKKKRNKPNSFKLSEILNDGKPIRIQNVSFNVFAVAFLKENRDSWDYINSQRVLSAAFNYYVHLYYQHCLHTNMGDWKNILARSPSDESAFTVEQAKRNAMGGSPEAESMSNAPTHSEQTSGMDNEAQRAAQHGHSQSQSMSEAPEPSYRVFTAVEEEQCVAEASDDEIAAKNVRGAKNAEKRSRSQEAREVREKAAPLPPQPTSQAPSMSAATATSSHLRSMNEAPTRLESPNEIPVNEPLAVDLNEVEIDPMERELQQKYFLATANRPATYHCLACGNNCHMTFDCPSFTCTLCGGDHTKTTCPASQRCSRCRQRGHQQAECPEKLVLSGGEAVGCDFCGLTDHLEVACHIIWRTFNPMPKEIRKVHEIPVYCYSCGATGHYGPECGLSQVRRILSGGQTFSKANALRYVDRSSAIRNMSAGVDYSIPSRPTKVFNIKGMANDPIELDDSDKEVTFISEKVKKLKQHGQINIAAPNRSGHSERYGLSHLSPETNLTYKRNLPREPRPDYGHSFGGNFPPRVDSTRYGRERTFSPPPTFDDIRYDVSGADDRFRPQAQHKDFYRPQTQDHYSYPPVNQSSLPPIPPSKLSSNASRGGGNLGGRRGGGNNQARREKRKKKGNSTTFQGPPSTRTRSKKQTK